MQNVTKAIFLTLMILSSCGNTGDKNLGNCQGKSACLNDPNCLCWCSVKCGYRKKNDTDHPIYIKKDRNGKFCYCKKWDHEHYKDNCELHKNMKEPEGAE